MTEGMRQKPMTKKRFDALMNGDYDEVVNKRIEKNYKLISLRMMPGDIKTAIHEIMDVRTRTPNDRSRVMEYLMRHRLSKLMADMTDF